MAIGKRLAFLGLVGVALVLVLALRASPEGEGGMRQVTTAAPDSAPAPSPPLVVEWSLPGNALTAGFAARRARWAIRSTRAEDPSDAEE